MSNKRVSRRPWWREKGTGEPETGFVVSEDELLNRVLLAKALIAHCGNQTVHFKTNKEDLEITPSVARDLLRKASLRTKKD